MASACCNFSPVISSLVFSLLFYSLQSLKFNYTNQPQDEANDLGYIRKKISKPAVKTIQSSSVDIIDCVLSHRQPAFDHPLLKGQKLLDQPERPEGHKSTMDKNEENFQSWTMSNESCPEGSIPIRRITKEDILRINSIQRFKRKTIKQEDTDLDTFVSERAVGTLSGGEYNGAKAIINVWTPSIAETSEHSQSYIRILAGSNGTDLDVIEVGWQVDQTMYGDNSTRFYTFWTRDSYKETGCYNLLCPGFVQINSRFLIGGRLSPVSSYNGDQAEMSIRVFRDPSSGNWWLEYGKGSLLGYWPSDLFTHLKEGPITQIEFAGEVLNFNTSGHTTTGMGSGHFAAEGYQKASYFRNLYIVDKNKKLTPISDLRVYSETPNCYSIEKQKTRGWGSAFFLWRTRKKFKVSLIERDLVSCQKKRS